ncbi:MAG: hypothetical protein HXY22_11145 [Alphaproteobacteria bacterium]|nr:hypothetical protein [Alphaproteobacteria bacterium]
MLKEPTGAEKVLCEKSKEGQEANCKNIQNPEIRAEFFRRFMLGLQPTSTCPEGGHKIAPSGIHVSNTRFQGRIDLEGAQTACCGRLPVIIFEECVFDGGFNGDHGHFSRLTFKDCKFKPAPADSNGTEFPDINLDGAEIEGDLILSGSRPLTTQNGDSTKTEGVSDRLWFTAEGARIDGDLEAKEAVFIAPNARNLPPVDGGLRYAVQLASAEIAGDLKLCPGVQLKGGISLKGAKIAGETWIAGAKIEAGDGVAINAQSAQFGAVFAIRSLERNNGTVDRTEITGEVRFLETEIRGSLDLNGIEIKKNEKNKSPETEEAGISAAQLHVHGSINMGSVNKPDGSELAFTSQMPVRFRDLKAGGSVYLEKAEICAGEHAANDIGVTFVNSRIGRNLLHSGTTSALLILNLDVEGGVKLAGQCSGPVTFEYGRIGGKLEHSGTPSKLEIRNLDVEGDVTLAGQYGGPVTFVNSRIGRNLWHSGTPSELEIRNLDVEGDVTLAGQYRGPVTFKDSKVSGALILDGFQFDPLRCKGGRKLDLQHVVVEGKLLIQEDPKRFSDPDAIQIQDARTIQLGCYPGWSLIDAHVVRDGVSGRVGFLIEKNGKGRSRILDGNSNKLHEINQQGALKIDTPAQAKEYLRLFCAYVWGEDGAFTVVEAESQLCGAQNMSVAPLADPVWQENGWKFTDVIIRYAADFFKAHFIVYTTDEKGRKGLIEMTDDTPLNVKADADAIPLYPRTRDDKPLVREPKNQNHDDASMEPPFCLDTSRKWKEMQPVPGRLRTNLVGLLQRYASAVDFGEVTIDLTDSHCGTLEDSDGRGWGSSSKLKLQNFTYDKTSRDETSRAEAQRWALGHWLTQLRRRALGGETSRPAKSRIAWLGQQFPRRVTWLDRLKRAWGRSDSTSSSINAQDYFPQTYTWLINVLRSQGDEAAARVVAIEKSRIEWAVYAADQMFLLRWVAQIAAVLYGVCYRYGYGPVRALATPLVFILLGGLSFQAANEMGLLVIGTTPVASVAVMGKAEMSPAIPLTDSRLASSTLPCGSGINTYLYAADIFIPLLDLRQEGRCDVRGATPEGAILGTENSEQDIFARMTSVFRTTAFWEWGKSLYAMLGWLVISLSIYTWIEAMRRFDRVG